VRALVHPSAPQRATRGPLFRIPCR
jgi:hypothetical protein